MNITYGSVCSGIESASVAWGPLGMHPVWFSEIEKFPCEVLAHYWPKIPNLGDMNNLPQLIKDRYVTAPLILVGGTPCQAFSVAGLRRGLLDKRGQLTIKYVEVANEIDKRRGTGNECITVWENVPGVLSSKDNAFGCFLGFLSGSGCELQPAGEQWSNVGCVYGPQRTIAWRVLDAQYFGVAQRRRRVFVIASARTGFDPTAVLFEREGVRRDTPPIRAEEQGFTAFTPSNFAGYREGSGTLRANGGDPGGGSETLICKGYHAVAFGEYADDNTASTIKARDYKDATDLICFDARQDPNIYGNLGGPVTANFPPNAVYYRNRRREPYIDGPLNLAKTVTAQYGTDGNNTPIVQSSRVIRRLTPKECERLQGFPDDFTNIKPNCPDGPRYKAIGNSKAVPVVRWIGQRIIKELTK